MGDFEEKLNAILSNPDAMAQIAGLAQSLDLGGGTSAPQEPPPPSPPAATPASGGASGGLGALSGLGDLLGSVDPKLIARLLPLIGELSGGNGSDERMALLYALRPFLKPERQSKIEQAARAARLIHVGKKLLTTLGESHV